MNDTNKVADMLNGALKADPEAIRALILHRVPANKAMQDHPIIQVNKNSQVGALGLINAILDSLGEPRLAIWYEIGGSAENFTGFTIYEPS